MSTSPEKRRLVAIYGRVSTEHEAQLSAFENQRAWYEDLAVRHPEWRIVERYFDDTAIMGLNRNQRQSDVCLVPLFLFSEDFSNQMRMYQF